MHPDAGAALVNPPHSSVQDTPEGMEGKQRKHNAQAPHVRI